MDKKKFIAIMLLGIMALMFLMGCKSNVQDKNESQTTAKAETTIETTAKKTGLNKTGYPIMNETITLKGFSIKHPANSEYKDMWIWQEMEKITNIKVEWDTPGYDSSKERLNLLLASGDYPDFILKNDLNRDNVASYGKSGVFIPLEKLIDEFAPNFKAVMKKYPFIKNDLSDPEGHIYYLPDILDYLPRNTSYPLLNMKWLEKVGANVPVTQSDWVAVLKLFRDKDPNENGAKDEIAFDGHTIESIMGAVTMQFGVDNYIGVPSEFLNGRFKLLWDDPRYKETLKFVKMLYDESLIDKEIFTQTAQKYFAKLTNNQVGYTHLYQPRNAGQYANDYDAIEPIKGPNGEQMWFRNSIIPSVTFIITKSNKYPEATMRWADFCYGDEGATMMYAGPEGVTHEKTADGFRYKKEILESKDGFENVMAKYVIFPGGLQLGYYTEKQLAPTMEGTKIPAFAEKVKKFMRETRRLIPMLSPEDATKVTQISNDINTYAKDMRAKFILGKADIDKEWDAYVKQLETLGIKELNKIYNDAFNR